MSKKAYDLGRLMGWSNVSAEYLKTFTDVVKPSPALKQKLHSGMPSMQ